jgi:hypothetical protein
MPALTPAQSLAIRGKALAAAAKIGRAPLVFTGGLRYPRGTRSPHTRFVIETKSAADLVAIRRVVAQVLGGSGNIAPGVSWTNRRLIVPSAGAAALHVNATFDVRFMFPGADPRDQRFKLANFVVLTLPIDPLSAKRQLGGRTGSLYGLAYAIRDAGNFVRVDPEIPSKGWRSVRVPTPAQLPTPGPPGPGIPGPGTLGSGAPHLITLYSGSQNSAPADHAWNLRLIGMPDSNTVLNNGGAGIRVGQVDSGTHAHPECDGIYAPLAQHGCTIDGENDPADPLPDPGINQPGHGIATASVLASRGRFTAIGASNLGTTNPSGGDAPPNNEVTGVATQCTVVPVRSVRSVFANVSNIDLAEGVWHCIEQNVHVITMSIAGICHPWLERVISFAVFNNVIVVAAAGQYVPWVPAPAVYPDCIAATGTTPLDSVWSVTPKGPAIDIAAPAVGVWCADARPGSVFVTASEGTSFAAPTIAGAAALWLVRHGRQALLQQYQNGPKLAEVFRNLIQSTARTPTGWDTSETGAGIIHITNLLNAPLPAANAVTGRNWTNYDASTEADILRTQLGNPNQNAFLAALARLFNSTVAEVAARMGEFGSEVMTLLETVPGAFDEFKNTVESEAQAAQAAAEEAVDNVVDAVNDFCSDVAGTVMGWFD